MVQPEDLSFMMKCSITLSGSYSFCSILAVASKPSRLMREG